MANKSVILAGAKRNNYCSPRYYFSFLAIDANYVTNTTSGRVAGVGALMGRDGAPRRPDWTGCGKEPPGEPGKSGKEPQIIISPAATAAAAAPEERREPIVVSPRALVVDDDD